MAIASLVGLTGILAPKNAQSDIVVRTCPPAQTWVADGHTEYRLDVIADSIQHPTYEIVSSEWDVVLPSPYFTCTRAEVPDNVNNPSQDPNDFFYSFMMQDPPGGFFNQVSPDFSHGGGESWNNRLTADGGATGPANRIGTLGHYWFTVSPDTPAGQYSFNLNGVTVVDSTMTHVYRSPENGGGVTVSNQPIRVTPPCYGDLNCDGRVTFADIDPFVEALSGESAWNQNHPACPWLNADCNGSGTVTFADIDPFVAVIGTTCP